ncbi:hypothetical protein O181_025224 [Austropuccinia psidii MF-1]|uniref:SSD domain-containing protein n=1 Tax=Austropuccinia psidii MF-1 TaxID=1389203 RepID=A0A9Q3CK52_9BASI|nr:hypothetical protein [Austropuccinia psidii MF-1]
MSSSLIHSSSSSKFSSFESGIGRCAIYGGCGKKGFFGQELPCPDNQPARKTTASLKLKLNQICGSQFESLQTACCTEDQIGDLSQSLSPAEPLISSCPACRNNFRQFYCHFTCSPNQASFLNVTSTQQVKNSHTGKLNQAVKSLDFWVDERFGNAFFNSCKEVKFGATNGYAIDLIGGGAKNWKDFLGYMGQERPGLGSPFQIDFPSTSNNHLLPITSESNPTSLNSLLETTLTNTTFTPLNPVPLRCDSSALDARCACTDCSSVCTSLPPSPPLFIPKVSSNTCFVGQVNCSDFFIIFLYSLALSGTLIYIFWLEVLKRRKTGNGTRRNSDGGSGYETPSGYERVSLHDPLAPNSSSESFDAPESDDEDPNRIGRTNNPLIGATSIAQAEGPERSRSIASLSPNESFFVHRRLTQSSSLTADADMRLMGIHHQPRSYPLNVFLSRIFYYIGFSCASRPYLTIALGFLLCGILNLGWTQFQIEKDPVKLWVAPTSSSAINKADFENRFGPFYRTEQIFLTSIDPQKPVLNYERLNWIFELEKSIRSLETSSDLALTSVCLSPTSAVQPPKSTSDCVVQSIMGYFGNSLDRINEANWADELNKCVNMPSTCLPAFGQPLIPNVILGGIPSTNNTDNKIDGSLAKAVIITYVLNNSLEPDKLAKAIEWETTLKNYLEQITTGQAEWSKQPKSAGLEMAWSTEISLEDEINKSTNTDIQVVTFSYLAMFLYVAISLGGSGLAILSAIFRGLMALGRMAIPKVLRFRNRNERNSLFPAPNSRTPSIKRQLLVESKFSLALWSILIVLLSLSTSVGLFSFMGVKITLIIAEVIPFLVLAIGVDNVFLVANEVSRQNSKAYTSLARGGLGFNTMDGLLGDDDDEVGGLPSVEVRIARAIARMGPSVLLSASCETIAFALGALVGMPAVRNFAIYAAGAVIINTILQMTIFASAIAIDLHRMESNRVDCFPCLKVTASISLTDLVTSSGEGGLSRFFRTIYAPILMKRPIKILALSAFSGIFIFSVLCSRKIELGLDQRLALPPKSHLVNYFDALDNFFDIGPPVYFVTKNINLTERANQQALCGRFSTCQELSLTNVLEAERKRPDSSFIAQPPAVWIDDFLQWLNPTLEFCCRVKKNDKNVFCTDRDRERDCQPCYKDHQPRWNITMTGLPEGEEFMRYLNHWLSSPTSEACPLGGKASYYNAIDLSSRNEVSASHFRTYHTPLKQQSDYINAMVSAHRIADDISTRTGATVYPYSIFYVFFDQYGRILKTSKEVVLMALLAVFILSGILLGSWRTGGLMCMTVFMIVMSIAGGMGAWGINLNAVSLVNLVIGIGIGVEFCSHIARAFIGANGGGLPHRHHRAQRDRDERVCVAMGDVGASVFSGIFSTKIIGILILGFTKSKLLEIYYFRIWSILIVSCGLHGLIFLPIILSYFGGQGFKLNDEDDQDLENLVIDRLEIEQQRNHSNDDNQ